VPRRHSPCAFLGAYVGWLVNKCKFLKNTNYGKTHAWMFQQGLLTFSLFVTLSNWMKTTMSGYWMCYIAAFTTKTRLFLNSLYPSTYLIHAPNQIISWGWFHQHAYALVLLTQILFCSTFISPTISVHKLCQLSYQIYDIFGLNFCTVCSSPGLGNVRPAGHMRPAKQLYVAHELFLEFSI